MGFMVKTFNGYPLPDRLISMGLTAPICNGSAAVLEVQVYSSDSSHWRPKNAFHGRYKSWRYIMRNLHKPNTVIPMLGMERWEDSSADQVRWMHAIGEAAMGATDHLRITSMVTDSTDLEILRGELPISGMRVYDPLRVEAAIWSAEHGGGMPSAPIDLNYCLLKYGLEVHRLEGAHMQRERYGYAPWKANALGAITCKQLKWIKSKLAQHVHWMEAV